VTPNFKQEALLWEQGSAFVFGIDEAGRGCLAGPVCAAVYAFSPGAPVLESIRDSKVIDEEEREAIFDEVKAASLVHGIGTASSVEIDKYNILQATCLAVLRATEMALTELEKRGHEIPKISFLTDGSLQLFQRGGVFLWMREYKEEFRHVHAVFKRGFFELPIVDGDAKVMSIAAASILAKVNRDRLMRELHAQFPQYAFDQHKGYSTAKHMANLKEHGPCVEHRVSFAPVRALLS
jgi:ribonuclease HII